MSYSDDSNKPSGRPHNFEAATLRIIVEIVTSIAILVERHHHEWLIVEYICTEEFYNKSLFRSHVSLSVRETYG
jgi:hypothetical protein